MLVSANTEVFLRIRTLPSLGVRNPLRLPCMSPELSYQASGADIGVLVPRSSCAVGQVHSMDLASRLSNNGVSSPSDISYWRSRRCLRCVKNMAV